MRTHRLSVVLGSTLVALGLGLGSAGARAADIMPT